MSEKRIGVMWMVASATAYSMFTVFGKKVLAELSATDVLLWRFLLAAPLAWIIVLIRARRGGPSPRSVAWKPRFAAGVVFGGTAWFAFAGLSRLSGALYIVIIYTYPAMVAVGARFLGRPASSRVWSAVAVILIGIALTVPELFQGDNHASVLGLVFTLANALTYSCYVLYSERLVNSGEASSDGLIASAWSFTGSLATGTVIAMIERSFHLPESTRGALSMIGLAVISTVIAGMAFFLGIKRLGPASAALIASVEPVLTLVWVVVILGETLKPVQLTGAALVIAGVVWSQSTSA